MKNEFQVSVWKPIVVFILAQISWGFLVYVWIYWYILRNQEIKQIMSVLPRMEEPSSWNTFMLIVGCILMGIILFGMYLVFVSFNMQVRYNKMQITLLNNVTHELKTPLATMRLTLETMIHRSLNPEQQRNFLLRCLSESYRLQRLIDGILVSARLERGALKPVWVQEMLSPYILESWNQSLGRWKEERHFVLDDSFKEIENFMCSFDKSQMEMLFNNLLDNAYKYSYQGSQIKLAASILKKGKFLRISIYNEGYGIMKTDIKKIFRKFYRSKLVYQNAVSGSGLGLFVCMEIVRLHKGKIYAESEGIDKGAVFYVELPGKNYSC